MKQITILLCMTALCTTIGRSQTEVCPEDRLVISETVTLWLNNYDQVQEDGLLGSDGNSDAPFLSKSQLQSFLNNLDLEGIITCPTLDFWYYMTQDSILHSAIGVNGDSTKLLALINGRWTNTNYASLSDDITRWTDYTMNPNNPLVYIKMYCFSLASISEMINHDNFDGFRIENVVHTISPNSTRYEFEYKNGASELEGFLAVDILLNQIKDAGVDDRDHVNFAMPCPKNCPSK